jgi:hypothetical protein
LEPVTDLTVETEGVGGGGVVGETVGDGSNGAASVMVSQNVTGETVQAVSRGVDLATRGDGGRDASAVLKEILESNLTVSAGVGVSAVAAAEDRRTGCREPADHPSQKYQQSEFVHVYRSNSADLNMNRFE